MNAYFDKNNEWYTDVFLHPEDFRYDNYDEGGVPAGESLDEFNHRTIQYDAEIAKKAREVIDRAEVKHEYHKFFFAGIPKWFMERDAWMDFHRLIDELAGDEELHQFVTHLVEAMHPSYIWKYRYYQPELLTADVDRARYRVEVERRANNAYNNYCNAMTDFQAHADASALAVHMAQTVLDSNDTHHQPPQEHQSGEVKENDSSVAPPNTPQAVHPSPSNEASQSVDSSHSGDSCNCVTSCQARNLLRQTMALVRECKQLFKDMRKLNIC